MNKKWIIRYDSNDFIYEELLDSLPDLSKKVDSISKVFPKDLLKIHIIFNTKFLFNQYYINEPKDEIILELNSCIIKGNIVKSDKTIEFDNLFNKISTDSVNLLYPALITDKRWNSIELPASSIYLGSALANNNIHVDVKKLILPTKQIDNDFFKYNVTGISIFEDLFIEISSFLENFSKSYSGFIVGGGPMVTLLPLRTAYHLKNINLLIRGEAEMVFPEILKLLSQGKLDPILIYKGFILNLPGLLVISDIDYINRPENFNKFNFNLNFTKDSQLKRGLEINISRGCRRSCVFCSKVQGKVFRKVEPDKFEKLLFSMSEKINDAGFSSDECRTLNINDDDILQEKEYAKKIFTIIKNNNFKLWGIQTSIHSFFSNDDIDYEIISIIDDKELFVSDDPLIWLGTDAFTKTRGKKLAKFIPELNDLLKLIKTFEDKKIKNIHYWISSDPDSTWNEFINEFIIIDNLRNKFKYFDVLAHAPFLVPYSSTPLNLKLTKSDRLDQIKYKAKLKSKKSKYDLFFAEKVVTKFNHLNRLLLNENTVGNKGFFDYIKENDRFNSFLTIYNFLKQERIESESNSNKLLSIALKRDEEIIENILSNL